MEVLLFHELSNSTVLDSTDDFKAISTHTSKNQNQNKPKFITNSENKSIKLIIKINQ